MVAAFLSVGAMAEEARNPGARPEVGKPIQAAIDLLKHKRARDALAKVREAQSVGNLTPYENYLVQQLLAQAAAAAGDAGTAARAFESVAGMSAAPDAHRRQFLAAAVGQYYAAKEYGKAADLAARYLRDGGDKSVRAIYIQSLYLGNNFGAAARAIAQDVESDEQAGRAPSEELLQLLASAYNQQKDAAGYARAMEKLVAYHPKKDYWLSVIHGIVARPGYADRLNIDLARLKIAAGVMRTADEYVEAAQLSLQDGFPMEATKIIDQGYAAGLLGAGPEAERHKRLKDLAAKTLAEDKAALARDEAQDAAGKEGKTLFNEGFNYVLHGKTAKGLQMMEQGLKLATGFRRPEHAKLQLAYGYHLAGQNQKAIQVFRSVHGTDGAASIARLWVIRLGRAS